MYTARVSEIDCLIIGSAEQDRTIERQSFLDVHRAEPNDGWGRFLKLNYVEFENDALMTNQLASLAYTSGRQKISFNSSRLASQMLEWTTFCKSRIELGFLHVSGDDQLRFT